MPDQYVSRAAYKLESAVPKLRIDFAGKTVLDVGSSTGGFSDYALQHGAAMIIAVDKGTDKMDSLLRQNPKIELHEKTDITRVNKLSTKVDLVLIDVSFVSIKKILPHVAKFVSATCDVVVLLKPQFEARPDEKNEGRIKNETIRREILKDFEQWARPRFLLIEKVDSAVYGRYGNRERFYRLRKIY